jgi:hypothetical protein
MAGIDFLNVFDKKKIYEEEGSALSRTRDTIDYDFGDNLRWLGANLLWRGDEFKQTALQEGAKATLEQSTADKADPVIKDIRSGLSGSGIKDLEDQLKLRSDETIEQYNTRLSGLKRTADMVLEAEMITPNFDRTDITSGDAGALTALVRGTKDQTATDNKNEARLEIEKERNYRARLDSARYAHEAGETNRRLSHEAAETAKMQAFDTQQTNARLAHESQQNNLTRQYQADLAKHDSETKLQIGMMESADRRADRRAAREDRVASQRQQSIAALMKGLTQLGAGFAI